MLAPAKTDPRRLRTAHGVRRSLCVTDVALSFWVISVMTLVLWVAKVNVCMNRLSCLVGAAGLIEMSTVLEGRSWVVCMVIY